MAEKITKEQIAAIKERVDSIKYDLAEFYFYDNGHIFAALHNLTTASECLEDAMK